MKEIYKLGNISIYPEQQETAHDICKRFYGGSRSNLLIGQPQQGKTGVCLITTALLTDAWRQAGETYEVVFLLNMSDNDLKDQNEKRLIQAGLEEEGVVYVKHHADLRNGKFSCNDEATKRLIIMDECHIALKRDKPLDNFLSGMGIYYGKKPETWGNDNTYVLYENV